METCVASPIEGNEMNIQINHGEDTYTVDKLKLSLLSEFVHDNFGRIKKPIKINENIAKESVQQLVSLIQYGKYELTKENVLDLLRISCEIRISAVFKDIASFIEDNFTLDELIAVAATKSANSPFFSGLSAILSHKLDSAMMIPEFADLGIEKLSRILTSEEAVYSDHHLLFSFVMELAEKNKESAPTLLAAIDIQRLSAEELEQLIAKDYFFSGEENKVLESDVMCINKKMDNINARIEERKGHKYPMEELNMRFKEIDETIRNIKNNINSNDYQSYDKLESKLDTTKRRTKNGSRRLTADLKTVQDKIKKLKVRVQKEFPVE